MIAETYITGFNRHTMHKLLAPAIFASLAEAHGHVTNIVINGVSFGGWDINSYPYTDAPPVVVAWGTPNTANGFIDPGMLYARWACTT